MEIITIILLKMKLILFQIYIQKSKITRKLKEEKE